MEQQVLQLLQATTVPDTETIKHAENSLTSLNDNAEFPFALLNIATHAEVEPGLRKSALTALRNYVDSTWSPSDNGHSAVATTLSPDAKGRIRSQVLAICVGPDKSNDISQTLAASVVSKIASSDFPDQWPELFPELMNILNTSSSEAAVLGSLRVLLELVDSGLSEEQFFAVARDLVNALQHVTLNTSVDSMVPAMALNVLRSCFEMLEQVMSTENGPAVKVFLEESLAQWMAFFMKTIRQPLPDVSAADFENAATGVMNKWKGVVALKIQTVKMIDKIKRVHAASLSSHVVELFQIVWEELSRVTAPYTQLFIDRDGDSKLVDSDGLPYTLDNLILENLDFLQSAMKVKVVRAELQKQMQQVSDARHTVGWIQDLLQMLVLFARIPQEEEGLWQFDANIYLCEMTAITSQYTPRIASADLLVRSLMEWLKQLPVSALLFLDQHLFASGPRTWKEREALLYLLSQCLKDIDETQLSLDAATSSSAMQQISASLQDENMFLRAEAHLCLGSLFKVAGKDLQDAAASSFGLALKAVNDDEAEIVNVSCLVTIPQYLEALPRSISSPLQLRVIEAIRDFLAKHDLQSELEDSDDVKAALIQGLRDAMMLDTSNLDQTPALDLFLNLASNGAESRILGDLLVEAFESLVGSVAEHGNDAYIRLCQKVVPGLTGAFHIADLRQENELTILAAELVSALAEFGFEPLPDGFAIALMPHLQRVLMEATDPLLVRSATEALTHIMNKGTVQYMAYTNDGKSAVETTLVIINRLLNSPEIAESAADKVGDLASSLVDKAGADGLGTHLSDLLNAVAIRLASAERAGFIQSLLMVFAGLATKVTVDVVNFLSEININGSNGLDVVISKWLENSVHFAGFDEIRQNTVALSKIYALHDPRIHAIQVKGDLIVDNTGRIKTRSQARLNPDRWTQIPADLKIIKILIDELKSAATSRFTDLGAARAAAAAADDDTDSLASDDDDGDWEDVGGGNDQLDLSSEKVKNELMAFAGEDGRLSPTGSRLRDDETADYLTQWFREEGSQQGFTDVYSQLKPEEQEQLQRLVG